MRKLLLEKIRLTWYLYFLFATFFLIKLQIPKIELGSGALTLFSVNSFLYGFYIGPIMSGQKARIEELTRIIRSEANALFSMLLETKSSVIKQKTNSKICSRTMSARCSVTDELLKASQNTRLS